MQNFETSYFFDLSNYAHKALFEDCEYVWDALLKIADYLKLHSTGEKKAQISPNAFLENADSIAIGQGTIVEPGAFIRGPCIIGENCVIRQGAYIRGNLIAGNSCVIGHDTEVKNAILLDNANAAHFAYLGDTILGNHVNLGAGTKCANLKFDHSPVCVRTEENQRISTGLKKFGAIIGDNSQTGCNSVTSPGTLLGMNVFCYPCVNVEGFVPSNTIVKSNTQIITKAKK